MTDEQPDHPAKFSRPILDEIRRLLRAEALRLVELEQAETRRLQVLDPFAGIGRIHELLNEHDTTGVELELEWARQHPRTHAGDATNLPASWTGLFDAVATSPVYPNRMTDTYDGKGKCRSCAGTGKSPMAMPGQAGVVPCAKCEGTGVDQSKRYTYRIYLGRPLSHGSSASMKWGPAYRSLHLCALIEMVRVVREDRLLIINMSNHFKTIGPKANRRQVEVEVVEWWLQKGLELGCRVEAVLPVETQRMGNGANRDDRADNEKIIVLRTPAERRLL